MDTKHTFSIGYRMFRETHRGGERMLVHIHTLLIMVCHSYWDVFLEKTQVQCTVLFFWNLLRVLEHRLQE